MKLETRELLGYTLELLPIEQFKEYFSSCKTFSTFSRKAFLKSVGIPPTYFFEQPDETQDDLLDNKEEILIEKFAGKYILILKKDNEVLNCVRMSYSDIDLAYNRLKLEDESKLIPNRDFISNGYLTNFIPFGKMEKGKYNLGIFVDYPIMLKKQPIIREGYYYLPKEGEEHYKNLYVSSNEIDYAEYQNLDMAIEESLDGLKGLKDNDIAEDLRNRKLLKETEEVLVLLKEAKVISKAYVKKISKQLDKNETVISNIFSLVDYILAFDMNFNNYKSVTRLRNILQTLEEILKS